MNGEPTIWMQFSEATTMLREEVVCIGPQSKTVKPFFLLFFPHWLPYGLPPPPPIFQHIREKDNTSKEIKSRKQGKEIAEIIKRDAESVKQKDCGEAVPRLPFMQIRSLFHHWSQIV